MAHAQEGDEVLVHYTGRLEDGTVFDSSTDREPLSFTIGAQQVIPGFEHAVKGMEPGDEKSTTIEPQQAYGEHHEEKVVEIARDNIPGDMEPEVGQRIHLRLEDGQSIPATITALSEEAITADANHMLAGRTLTFDIELVDIKGNSQGNGQSNIITP